MKVFLVILSAAVVTAGVTTNERELGEVPEVPAVPEITEVPKVPENKKLPLSDLDKNELDIPNLPEEDDLNVPDLPEDTDLDVPDGETKGDLDDEADLATARNNLSFGTFGSNDRLMSRITHNVAAASLLIHDQEITFRGVRGTNITAIRMKTYLAVTLLVAVVTAGVTTNERDLAVVPEDKKLHLSDFIEREDLYVPDSPENTDLDVRELEIKGEEDEETNLATTRNNLSLGSFGSNDRLMSR
ncbi:unnamed protein product [Spodoptera exigua]|nr:unnamed protein product [Spodoptera exigua]